ncbi:MAG: hypothetical protein WCA77_05310 [Thermoplasmata archaeon]
MGVPIVGDAAVGEATGAGPGAVSEAAVVMALGARVSRPHLGQYAESPVPVDSNGTLHVGHVTRCASGVRTQLSGEGGSGARPPDIDDGGGSGPAGTGTVATANGARSRTLPVPLSKRIGASERRTTSRTAFSVRRVDQESAADNP